MILISKKLNKIIIPFHLRINHFKKRENFQLVFQNILIFLSKKKKIDLNKIKNSFFFRSRSWFRICLFILYIIIIIPNEHLYF